MQLHQFKPIHKTKKRKRVGRGGKRGTYSGRGMKGQGSRAGSRIRPALRDLIKTIPKLRGVKFKKKIDVFEIVNLSTVEVKFNEGETVSPESLLKRRLIRRIKGRTPKVKILGSGSLTKKVLVKGCETSKGARKIIEKVGGKVEV